MRVKDRFKADPPGSRRERRNEIKENTMGGVTMTLELSFKMGMAASFIEGLPTLLEATRAFPGFLSARIARHTSDTHRLIFIEEWESAEACDAYFVWRAETGDFASLLELLSEEPRRSIWESPLISISPAH
jgi:quinol monooxygenase YgiN